MLSKIGNRMFYFTVVCVEGDGLVGVILLSQQDNDIISYIRITLFAPVHEISVFSHRSAAKA